MYAFTVMLNELLSEELPFLGMEQCNIMMEVVTRKGRPNAYTALTTDTVGCRLMRLIGSGWNQDPSLRMSFQDITTELNQLLEASADIALNGVKGGVDGDGS